MKGEVLIAGIAGIILGAVAASLLLAGPGIPWPGSFGQAAWTGLPRAGWGMGMMGPGMMSSGSLGMYRVDSVPITLDEAERRASNFARQLGEGYVAEDIMEFTENFYAVIEKERSGAAITEILVDRYNGQVTVEPGPAVMWRIQTGTPGAPAAYDIEAARSRAGTFLWGYLPGARILEIHAFPGYYTLDFGRDGAEGMLSVNAFSGAIWVHTWHGLPLAAA